ncbi:hypothetical protein EW026_g8419 [Hermanssonia centrifuga]|uniref:Helicase C-terminal domain-containing protein n=1 Tax=Hermanssonia centrifuga TaxID=98765 RepID=A0A4S4K5V8_9APHY|nr:hypothetical protein EW026_g8419 [Hermanssonia centrifuga]
MHKDLAAALKKDRKRRKDQGAHTGLQEALSGHVDTGSGKPITAHQRVVLSNLESLKSKFDGHVIRRNHESVDRDGKPILGLPPYKQSILVLEACQKELEMLDDLTDNAEERSKSSAPGMFTLSFYLGFRRGVTHWSFADPSASIPPPKTLAEWTSTKSTKLDAVVQIIKHHLANDDAAMLHEVGDHNVLTPQADHVPRTDIITPDKIVVYSAFTSHNAFIRQVFKVNGIDCMEITGAAPMAQRTKTLSAFRASGRDGPRVLIISQVGSVGLNIEFANVLVLLDSCWSAVEDLQTIGRLHRVPQSKQVIVYRPLLKGSADGWLFQNSHDKASVADAFTQSSERLRNTLRRLEEESVADDESVASSAPKRKSKGKRKADSDTDNDTAEAPPKKKKGKAKAKNVQSDANNVQPDADNVPAGPENVQAGAENVQAGADQPAEAIPKPPVDKGKGKAKAVPKPRKRKGSVSNAPKAKKAKVTASIAGPSNAEPMDIDIVETPAPSDALAPSGSLAPSPPSTTPPPLPSSPPLLPTIPSGPVASTSGAGNTPSSPVIPPSDVRIMTQAVTGLSLDAQDDEQLAPTRSSPLSPIHASSRA